MFKFAFKNFCAKKKVFVTTPIFYVNSKPHIGHLYSAILASAVKQVLILQKESVDESSNNNYPFLSTGTDEHGLKIQQKAKESNIIPQQFCDQNSKAFRELFDLAKIDYDAFIRTSDQKHKEYAMKFWSQLMQKGKISKSDYSGFYSVQEESFIPEKDLIKIGDKFYTALSKHSNQHVEFITEQNYQIKFTQDDIERYNKLIQDGKLKFVPESIVNEVKGYINQNLMQLCVSRPSKRVSWGIDVPDDTEHVIYVWFEALLNYLTVADQYFKTQNENKSHMNEHNEQIEFIHIIGKDISKFHCYIWPLLLILNNSFPFKLTVLMHNYWLKSGTKMSKSIGNVVDPEALINKFGTDAVRFYFLASGPQLHDVSFDEKALTNVFYRNIPDTFINLLLRLSNNKIIDINKYSNIRLEDFNMDFQNKIKENMKLVELAKKELIEYNFNAAAHNVHLILLNLNNLIQTSEFWKKTEDFALINQIACFSFEFVRIISTLFVPYLPELMRNVNKYIGVDEKYMKLKFCFFRGEMCDTFDEEVKLFNDTSKEGYFKVNLEFKQKIFVNKIK